MTYDRDLRWIRRTAWALFGANVGSVIAQAYQRDWFNAVASAIWVLNCWLWISLIRTQQITRDQMRITEAAWQAVQEEAEGME